MLLVAPFAFAVVFYIVHFVVFYIDRACLLNGRHYFYSLLYPSCITYNLSLNSNPIYLKGRATLTLFIKSCSYIYFLGSEYCDIGVMFGLPWSKLLDAVLGYLFYRSC